MKKFAVLTVWVTVAVCAQFAAADILSLRDYVQTVVEPAVYPAQTGSELWQFRVANTAATGSLLSPGGIYYYYPFHPNLVPIAGNLYDIGEGGVLDSSFDSVFTHPGAVPLGVVLQIQDNNTYIDTVRVLGDFVDNGFNSNGVGLTLYTNINSVASAASSRVVWTAVTLPDPVEYFFPINQTLDAGDRIEFYLDNNGNEFFDHAVIDIQLVNYPEPASAAMLGLGAVALLRRR